MSVHEPVRYVSAPVDAVFDERTHAWVIGDRRAGILIASDGALPGEPRGDALAPYLGVAVHGVPNYFLLTGPDVAAQKSYIAACLQYLSRTGGTRIEVRAGAQRTFHERSRGATHRSGRYWRRVGTKIGASFEIRSRAEADDDGYDGPATVHIDGRDHRARVRLTGRIDPVDGRYHWQGTMSDTQYDGRLPQDVTVTMDGTSAHARLTERTPQSTYSVVGVGAPPFPLDDLEVDVPQL